MLSLLLPARAAANLAVAAISVLGDPLLSASNLLPVVFRLPFSRASRCSPVPPSCSAVAQPLKRLVECAPFSLSLSLSLIYRGLGVGGASDQRTLLARTACCCGPIRGDAAAIGLPPGLPSREGPEATCAISGDLRELRDCRLIG